MAIKKKRIRKPENYIQHLKDNDKFYIGVDLKDGEHNNKYPDNISYGESFLPSKNFGNASSYNADGKYKKLKHLPKITDSTPVWWEWKDFTGKAYSELRHRSFQRYQREHIEPPCVGLKVVKFKDSDYIIADILLEKNVSSLFFIKHVFNLILEIFGKAIVLNQDLSLTFPHIPTQDTLKWEILPPGEYPWTRIRQNIDQQFLNPSRKQKLVYADYLDFLKSFKPDKLYIGVNGYSGYIVYLYKEKGLCVFENPTYGNATYVFEGEWRELSQLTKKEIIREDLYKYRVIHHKKWKSKITEILA